MIGLFLGDTDFSEAVLKNIKKLSFHVKSLKLKHLTFTSISFK